MQTIFQGENVRSYFMGEGGGGGGVARAREEGNYFKMYATKVVYLSCYELLKLADEKCYMKR